MKTTSDIEETTLSRLPRFQEHLKTGFTAEAASAARFRAYAQTAEDEEMPNLARRWREMAAAKDALAIRLLKAAGQIKGAELSIANALAEEEYENEVLYPKMIRDVDEETAEVLRTVVEDQEAHITRLQQLRGEVQAATGDVG
jgi:rubrerythrin